MIPLAFVTLISLLVAIVMTAVAWRMAAEERRRSSMRVATLAADIHDGDFDLRADDADASGGASADMFAIAQPAPSGSRLATVIACGVILVGSLATVGLLVSSGSHTAKAATADNHATPAATAAAPVPLELLALGHERTGDDLTVRGVVRNPPSGVAVERLTAVVFLFSRDGSFLTSGRATVDSPALVPGGESRFIVTVPSAADVGRYRVSFRTDDRVVPHIDRREPALARR